MSYTVGIWQGEVSGTFEEAEEAFGALRDSQEELPASPTLVAFVQAMLGHFPEPDVGADDVDEDEWIWSDSPLINNVEGCVSVLSIAWDHVGNVLPVIVQEANQRGLHVIDWQTGEVYPSK